MSSTQESKLYRPSEPKPHVRVSRDVVNKVVAVANTVKAELPALPSYTISLKDILILWLLAIVLLLSWGRIQLWASRWRWPTSAATVAPESSPLPPAPLTATTPPTPSSLTPARTTGSAAAPVAGPGWCVVATFADHGAARGCAYVSSPEYCASGKMHATKVDCLLPPKKENPSESSHHALER
jgi:hypothetical protein